MVVTSITGLIVLFEMNIETQNNIAFDGILDLTTVLLGSILIPSLFSRLNKKENKIEINNKSVDK